MNLQPPEAFDFFHPSTWSTWRQRFERFRIASKFHLENEPIQISAIIYCMGKEVENVLKTFKFSKKEDENDFEIVMIIFEAHFLPKKKRTHEKAIFHLRTQRTGQCVSQHL